MILHQNNFSQNFWQKSARPCRDVWALSDIVLKGKENINIQLFKYFTHMESIQSFPEQSL